MTRAIVFAVSVLALLVGGYQAWVAFQLLHSAPIYSGALGMLPRYSHYLGLDHFETVLHLFVAWPITEVTLSAAAALALVFGGWLLLTRRSIGRKLIVVGCVVVVAHTCVGWAVAMWLVQLGTSAIALLWFNTPSKLVIVLLSFATPVITVVLASLPATRQWCVRGSAGVPAPADLGMPTR